MLTDQLIADRPADQPRSTPPPGVADDWTIPQHWERFTAEDHRVWDLLFARQQELLEGRAVRAFHEGLDVLRLSRPGIPQLDELNERLFARTGWTVVSVPGLVPDDIFFEHLSNRRFPAGISSAPPGSSIIWKSRTCSTTCSATCRCLPSLTSPTSCRQWARRACMPWRSARCTGWRGSTGTRSSSAWPARDGALKIYGAGILSSFGESRFALESPEPNRPAFDIARVLRTRYRSDAFQQSYFVIDSFEELLRSAISGGGLARMYDGLECDARFGSCHSLTARFERSRETFAT
jgi:phenylalanine-4-hydroxylase